MADLPLIYGAFKLLLLSVVNHEAPNEAVGIIYQNRVFTLRNTSASPHDRAEIDIAELRSLLTDLEVPLDRINEDVIIWHSHPGGGVGPSRHDMVNRTPLKHHLVLSLVEGDLVATWY